MKSLRAQRLEVPPWRTPHAMLDQYAAAVRDVVRARALAAAGPDPDPDAYADDFGTRTSVILTVPPADLPRRWQNELRSSGAPRHKFLHYVALHILAIFCCKVLQKVF